MNTAISRRRFIAGASGLLLTCDSNLQGQASTNPSRDRYAGLLLGGLIGDALGGPVEFSEASSQDQQLVGARSWSDGRKLSGADLVELANTVPLLSYEKLRPDASPYGPWRSNAVSGTVTDDSRHKIVMIRAISRAKKQGRPVTAEDIANALIDFAPVTVNDDRAKLLKLDEEGFREYRYAARWLLGERDLDKARPVERLWAGIANCSGQMMLPPLAISFAGQPTAAYKVAYQIDFIDAPLARDITAALVAGLATALDPRFSDTVPQQRWDALLRAIRETDPYRFADIPFAGRPLHKWLDKADELVQRSEGQPKRLYHLLETEGRPVYWWDAHFTLLVPLCMLKICDFNPMAAMHLTLDFGHDTDSYAQVLGCMAGAVHGVKIFSAAMVDAVKQTVIADYGEDVQEWLEVLLP